MHFPRQRRKEEDPLGLARGGALLVTPEPLCVSPARANPALGLPAPCVGQGP